MDPFEFEANLVGIISELIENKNSTKIIVVNSESDAQSVEETLRKLSHKFLSASDIICIPGFFQAGVFRFESVRKVIAKRIAASASIGRYFPRIIVCSLSGFCRNFPEPSWIYENELKLYEGLEIDPDLLVEQLSRLTYMPVQRVEEVGEYCIRGSIIDFWTPGEKNPSRVEIFGDEIEKIRSFRPQDQRSFQSLKTLTLLPSREFVWPFESQMNTAVEKFNHSLLSQKIMGMSRNDLLDNLRANVPFAGIDDVFYMFAPKVFDAFHKFISKLSEENKVSLGFHFLDKKDNLKKSINDIENLYVNSYQAAVGKNYPVANLEVSFPALHSVENYFLNENVERSKYLLASAYHSLLKPLEKQKFSNRMSQVKQMIGAHTLEQEIENILFLMNSQESFIEFSGIAAKYFSEFETEMNLDIPDFSALNLDTKTLDAKKISENIYCSVLTCSGVFYIESSKTLAVGESWLRGNIHSDKFENYNAEEKSGKEASESFMSTQFAEFVEGDLVVHVQHGIARFRGLMTISIMDITGDFLVLEYAGNDKIYVPVHKLNLVQKYIGSSQTTLLDSLKGSSWEKRKLKVRADVEKLAQELMEHSAKRAMSIGHAFAKVDEEYISFEDAFPFDETPDQHKAIKDIMNDMSKPKPMDRLLCGDVGFGKTEVAMRAAYRCVLDGKQVAWLVPTTILAHQHFRSLKERFAQFGLNIEVLDRSISGESKVLEGLKTGRIDIIIGTHRILSKDMAFRDLGLLIVDEEQRFGVLQKEKIKAMSYGIDALTMTATPIPRTLQMAMVGLRDLSLLTTPPKARLAIKTFVCPFEDGIIKESLQFELSRGGQIFYVHNRVEELESVQLYLKNLLPQIRICIGHGKMTQKELDKTIIAFLDGHYDLLLCTTIIESGVDMPNVNTILVQNADNFGLAQLYQIRGRVGRRSTRGYAYFLTSQNVKEGSEGMRRLEILKEHQELGSGFAIASHDLELRGAGNIMGDEQSGKVNDVGLETYLQMLDDKIRTLGGRKPNANVEVEMRIPVVAKIPEDYIENSKERLRTYRRYFGANQESLLESLITECIDRFGALPKEVVNLAEISRIRRYLLSIGGLSLSVGDDFTEICLDKTVLQPDSYDEASEILVKRILDVCNRKTKGMRISPDGKIILPIRKKNFNEDSMAAMTELKRTLSLLAGDSNVG